MIRELVENYEDNKNIVDNLNIHILPMANPDGYEYSRSSVSYSSSTSSF
jgi:murein tripeptide amidase MpaA